MALAIIYCILAAIFGITYCFFGYKHLKKLFMGFGFLIGALVSYVFLSPVLSVFLAILISVLIGVAVGLLIRLFYIAGLFLTGMCFGFLLCRAAAELIGASPESTAFLVIAGVISIILGVLSVIYRRILMIISTSFTGSYCIVMYGGFLISSMSKAVTLVNLSENINAFYNANSLLLSVALTVLGVTGMLIQLLITAPRDSAFKKTAKHRK